MYRGKKFLAVIPARGGSKGIPKKNIIDLAGKPLIQYTIDAALNSLYLDEVIVSTDCKDIAEVSINCGAKVPFIRPSSLAADESTTIDVLIHAIEEQRKAGKMYDYIVLLQPTQPLRKTFHIDESIEEIVKAESDSLVGVTKVMEHPILMRTISEDNKLSPLLNVNSTVRRQDFPDYYKVNGAIYINKLSNFSLNTSLNDNQTPYIMESNFSIDIDEMFDLKVAELLIRSI
ncbi:cytidylyltransferase domain-containing protein [Sutcliffiella horikoshii]|uniref:acylneuraminate cytidylyltransferase family protein n=1 Tax=Sutcliffiella horikoshii TaxID=79883 RepID=UPI00384EC9AE